MNSKKTRSPNGVISYLNSLITIWNKSTDHKNPFSGVKPKKQKTKSKALTVDDLLKIKNNDYASHMNARGGGIKNYLNYLMLCFYLGRIDLGDLVNLRYDEHVSNGRIEFNRFKGGTNVLVSNYIFPEAWELLQKYDCKPYLIPLALTNNYNTFIPNMSRYFASIQEKLKLSKKPYSKAPRYSFITRAQQILIDERITIKIVGHSQQSTHSIYKDEFPFHVRDEAHKKIIDLNYNHL
ncbi:hypothetical protein D1815_08135 [Aquimarina sp. AD1]|uniref:hypothetical protein n=1 Tax=Aquimarina sp. (strain AD1) TaxID=1714848 RepID=UPI000E508866|nr:hypothetical protein [Aquimarina sp. AD1]AXT55719.1 hypothetical protein D1815_08135 [Aquimarina sp. AD1]RKN09848.1 hypothetical protein D7035_19745 [Aquimarina sp. AD1]